MKKTLLLSVLIIQYSIIHCQNVGIGTTTPTARLHIADSNVVFTGPASLPGSTTYNPPIQGAGTRMMWYPQKAAFRVGQVYDDRWDKENIGNYSMASGENTQAIGSSSNAMGSFTNASGFASTAMGASTSASGSISTAIGLGSSAYGNWSTAIGTTTTARSLSEIAIGSLNTDYNPLSYTDWYGADRLFVIGNGSTANTKSDALVILKNGNMGIGTSSPNYKLHIGTAGSGVRIEGPATSGGIALGIGGFGDLQIDKPNAAGGRFIVKDNGNVGIGASTPQAKLQVSGAMVIDGTQTNHAQGAWLEWNKDGGGGATYFLNQSGRGPGGIIIGEVDAANNVKQNLVIEYNGNATLAGVLTQNSDERLKKNIHQLSPSLENLQQLNGYTYDWIDKGKDKEQQIGLLAQEVQKIYPQLVKTAVDGTLSVNYSGLVPVLIEGIKEQQKQIDQLKQLVKTLINK